MRDLETKRLKMRACRDDDVDLMAPMYADPDVTAFTKLGCQTRDQTKTILEEYLATWRERRFGIRAMFRKRDLAYVGECGLFVLSNGDAALRYALLRRFWGQGLATEAVEATINDAFTAIPLDRVMSIVQTRNPASVAVMERVGWRVVRTGQEGDIDLLIYERTRAEWRSKKDGSSVKELQETRAT